MTTLAPDTSADDLLRLLAGPDAQFREHQREAIEDLVVDRRRVLCVQRTGWGKSAVYFIASAMLRAQGEGPTLLISPLLALMRNQIEAAERGGGGAAAAHLAPPRVEAPPDRGGGAVGPAGPPLQQHDPQRVGGGARPDGARRGRPAADPPRAAKQPPLPRHDAAAVRAAR